MAFTVKGDKIYVNGAFCAADMVVEGERIASVGNAASGDVLDLTGYHVLPGLIDTHVHGGDGYDTMDCTREAVRGMSMYQLTAGVTTFCPTTVTSPMDKTELALRTVADCMDEGLPGAKSAGVYLEGPYINPMMKGAHPEEFIRNLNIDELARLLETSRGTIRTVALAPEKPGAPEAVEYLVKRGVTVTLGHSNATYEETMACIQRGARAAVHIYNAMRPLHHREPGILGAALSTDGFAVEAICDGIHVHPKSMELVMRCKRPEDVVLITDCLCAGGMADGQYKLGELAIRVENGIARTLGGALAGSTMKLAKALYNVEQLMGVPFETAVRFATENPARQLGIFDKVGSLAAGKYADMIAVDESCNVVLTMVSGKILFDRRA